MYTWITLLSNTILQSPTKHLRYVVYLNLKLPSYAALVWHGEIARFFHIRQSHCIRFSIQSFPGEYTKIQWMLSKNKEVDSFNFIIQHQNAENLHSYTNPLTDDDESRNHLSDEILELACCARNSAPFNLQLKVGSIIIMVRKLNHPKLCNGSRNWFKR